MNFSSPLFVFVKFWELYKKHLAVNFIKVSKVRGWGKIAPDRVRAGMLKWSGKVGLGKVLLSCNSK